MLLLPRAPPGVLGAFFWLLDMEDRRESGKVQSAGSRAQTESLESLSLVHSVCLLCAYVFVLPVVVLPRRLGLPWRALYILSLGFLRYPPSGVRREVDIEAQYEERKWEFGALGSGCD